MAADMPIRTSGSEAPAGGRTTDPTSLGETAESQHPQDSKLVTERSDCATHVVAAQLAVAACAQRLGSP
jgi:hypothetical protein